MTPQSKLMAVCALIKGALNELGVPGEGYPAPVANAVALLTEALTMPPIPVMPASVSAIEEVLAAHRLNVLGCWCGWEWSASGSRWAPQHERHLAEVLAALPPTDPQAPRWTYADLERALRRALPADMVFAYRPTGDPFAQWAQALFDALCGSVVHAAGDPPAATEEAVGEALDRAIERRDEYIEEGKGIPTPLATLIWEELTGRKSEYTALMSGATPEEPEPRVTEQETLTWQPGVPTDIDFSLHDRRVQPEPGPRQAAAATGDER